MLRMQIVLPAEMMRVLYELAERERRNPRDQAALLLTEVLKRREQTAQHRWAQQREREVARVTS